MESRVDPRVIEASTSSSPELRYRPVTPVLYTIGQVSMRWNAIAWSTPHLWQTIYFPTQTQARAPRSKDIFTPTFHEHLARSNGGPLDIFLDVTSDWNASEIEDLLIHSNRWRSLVITIFRAEDIARVTARFKDISTPRLEHLQFIFQGHTRQQLNPEALALLPSHQKPLLNPSTFKLTTLKLDSVPLAFSAFSFTYLTTLDLRHTAWPDFPTLRRLFHFTPLLHTLIIHTHAPTFVANVGVAHHGNPIILSSVRNLVFAGFGSFPHAFLWTFKFPSLQDLCIQNLQSSDCKKFLNLLTSSSPSKPQPQSLRHLSLVNIRGETKVDLFDGITATFVQIRHLTLVNIPFTLSAIRALGNVQILPSLESITVAQWTTFVHIPALRHLLTARLATNSAIKKLILDEPLLVVDAKSMNQIYDLVSVERVTSRPD